MIKQLAAVGILAVLLATGCGATAPDSPQDSARTAIRDVYPDASDSQIDSLAASVCSAVEAALDAGLTGEQAMDDVYLLFRGMGYSDSDALTITVSAVAGWCPLETLG